MWVGNNKILLYIQYPVINHDGKECEKEYICKYMHYILYIKNIYVYKTEKNKNIKEYKVEIKMTWGNKKSNKMVMRDTSLESKLNHSRIQTSLGITRRTWVSLIHQAYIWKRIERPKGRELIMRKR